MRNVLVSENLWKTMRNRVALEDEPDQKLSRRDYYDILYDGLLGGHHDRRLFTLILICLISDDTEDHAAPHPPLFNIPCTQAPQY
jgi:hypothetical protein